MTNNTNTNHNNDIEQYAPLLCCTSQYKFAYYTATVRWPKTIQDVINNNKQHLNDYNIQLLQHLIQACDDSNNITLNNIYKPSVQCSEYDDWSNIYNTYKDNTLHEIPWLISETYLYHLILTATDYFNNQIDPFYTNKQNELNNNSTWQTIASAIELCKLNTIDMYKKLSYLLELTVYSNRIDLSYHTLTQDNKNRIDTNTDTLIDILNNEKNNIIINDTNDVIKYMKDKNNKLSSIHIICDNSGNELLCDLVLVYYVLTNNIINNITMHVKQYPTFVSDATTNDVIHTIQTMCNHSNSTISQCGQLLQQYIDNNTLNIISHSFWNSYYCYDKLSDDLINILKQSDLTLIKGDLNYRRVVHDRLWPTDISIYDNHITAAQKFPSNFLLLRTLKSDTIVNGHNNIRNELDKIDNEWRVNGKRGVIQLHLLNR